MSNSRRIGLLILARLDSQRLPGKALLQVHGRPLLWYLVQRLQRCSAFAEAVVATTRRPVDDPLVVFSREQGLQHYRGELEDVALRMLSAAREFGFDYFFRVNGDSPCLEPRLLEQAVTVLEAGTLDLVTNLYPRSFPYGVSVELIRTDCFREVYPQLASAGEREHATQFFYRNITRFRYHNILRQGPDLSVRRLTVDSAQDLAWFETLVSAAGERWPSLGYEEILALKRGD